MKKTLLLFILSICFINNTIADTKPFELKVTPELITDNSLYNNFEFIDSREFKQYLGFVQTSMLNFFTAVIDRPTIEVQLHNAFRELTNDAGKKGTLVLQLRRLYFSEVTKNFSETGYCHIRYSLYEKTDNRYHFINTLDTLISVKAMDVTSRLLDRSSKAIVSHLANSLTLKSDTQQSYSEVDVLNIHYFEKGNLKLYSNNKLEDGVYKNYQSFANQTPTKYNIEAIFQDSVLLSFKAKDWKTNKAVKFKEKDIYAIVIDGKAYASVHKCYLPLYKKDGEYRFVSEGSIKNSTFFLTNEIPRPKSKLTFKEIMKAEPRYTIEEEKLIMTIDHLTGEYIPTPLNASVNYYYSN